MTNREQLKQYIKRHGLNAVADALRISVSSLQNKCKPDTSSSSRPVSDNDLDLIKLRLGGL